MSKPPTAISRAHRQAILNDALRLLTSGPYLTFSWLFAFSGKQLAPITLTNTEIGHGVGISEGTARNHLLAIERIGLFTRQPGRIRKIHWRQPELVPFEAVVASEGSRT